MIEIRKVRKAFGDLEVLKGIDLTVNNGEVISVIGASGSGNPPCSTASTAWSRSRADRSSSTVKTSMPGARI